MVQTGGPETPKKSLKKHIIGILDILDACKFATSNFMLNPETIFAILHFDK